MSDTNSQPKAFPAQMPREKPDRPLSAAMQRWYDTRGGIQDYENPFYTNFKYSRVTGIGADETTSRRDPSKVLKINGKYYVWYTRRHTKYGPVSRDRLHEADDERPAVDWDLADIAYATSDDGFQWEEQGIAVHRAPKGTFGDRSLSTPDVLAYGGRFFLFYQTFTTMWRQYDCVGVSMAWADSPDGPWTRTDEPVVPAGAAGDWDGCAVHDPYPLVYQGKIWLYYKGHPGDKTGDSLRIAQGVAIAEDPFGPYVKSPLNPTHHSGHETMLWPFKEGIAMLCILDGPEKNTVQYAPDGLNFSPMAHVQMPPIAPGPFCPDAFADNGDGRGIHWGLSHINPVGGGGGGLGFNCHILRWDCALSRDIVRPEFKRNTQRFDSDTWFQRMTALPEDWRARILAEQSATDRETILK